MTEFARDAAMTAVIFGFFASGWFGWAQEDPPPSWRKWLTVGSIVSLLTAAVGGVLAWQAWGTGTAIDRPTGQAFGIVVGIEVVLAVAGVLILRRRGRADLAAPWVALIVGLHFFPLAYLFGYPLLHVTAALFVVASLIWMPISRARNLTPSAITGVLSGAILLASALASLAVAGPQLGG